MAAERPAPRAHRDTIAAVDARVLAHEAFDGAQHVLRVSAPAIAARARPGQFVHLRCAAALAMRRPLSIMRVDPHDGWVELLYKVVGEGTALLARQQAGTLLSVLGPIGNPFDAGGTARPLLLGGGVGMPPMIFLAERLRAAPGVDPLVLLGSEVPFPFATAPSALAVAGMDAGIDACMPLLESWGVASRLASAQGYAGCHAGYVTDLARAWLDALEPGERQSVAVFACGPTPMLRAAAALAGEYALPSQLCLEEFMACAVGGCAGCAVRVRGAAGPAMKRVCVDGPVFDGATVVWDAGG